MAVSPSYKQCYCGVDCPFLDMNDDEPCWGEVCAVDEWVAEDYSDHEWIHACEGHSGSYIGKAYKRESS